MLLFQDISRFSRMTDYLPIINGAFLVEIVVLYLSLTQKKSSFLQDWYKKYRLAAVMADVLVVILGIVITRLIYPFIFKSFSIWKFVGLLLCIQILHDILFYMFFMSVPKGMNIMLDLFKDYAGGAGITAILGDSLIVIFSALFASIMAAYSVNTNIVILLFSLYFIPYFLYIK